MGATKTELFTSENLKIALLSRAFAHPARVRIIELLRENTFCRNIDLAKSLKLSRTTVYDHLQKLKQAELINYSFNDNFYIVRLEKNKVDVLMKFLSEGED